MAKTFNSEAAKAIAHVNAHIPEGINWKQRAACNAILIVAENMLIGAKAALEDRKAFMNAINDLVNPSACAQAMAAMPKDSPCYRPRVTEIATGDEPC